MKIREVLTAEQKRKLGVKEEKLTERDWREIMGNDKETYKRVNGRIRRK